MRINNNVSHVALQANGNLGFVNVALSIELIGSIVHAPNQHLVLLFT